MLDLFNDKRIVMTLDAGGTNFVFNAMKAGKLLLNQIERASQANNLNACLKTIIEGFETVKRQINEEPVAISFAFPGPADYTSGIIGDLVNLPSFRGGIALGDMLINHFNIPVFIKNDGDLYAYGEALGGILPEVNQLLEKEGSLKKYKNLIGITLGTGFGAGFVNNGHLIEGDNSNMAEVWNIANSITPEQNAEEAVSTRAIINDYKKNSGNRDEFIMPKDIYEIATGQKEGNKKAALFAFENFGTHLGDSLSTLIMLFDGLVVIGGGITGASQLYMPSAMRVLNGSFKNKQSRLTHKPFLLDNELERNEFFKTTRTSVLVPFSDKKVDYDPVKKIAVTTTKIGASKAISLGAYAFALSMLD